MPPPLPKFVAISTAVDASGVHVHALDSDGVVWKYVAAGQAGLATRRWVQLMSERELSQEVTE